MTGSSMPLSPPEQEVACDLAAHAWVMGPAAQVAEWRRSPGPGPGKRLPASFLKHADEQTVAGLVAVCQALHRHGLEDLPLTDWGVVAAPRLLGRPLMVSAVQRFLAEGAWGISPNLIPHRSLHSLSGTVSQAVKAHGPNFGAGSAAEALTCAAGLLAGAPVAGVLVVLTAWDPEPLVLENGEVPPGTRCAALALALMPPYPGRPGVRLTVVAGAAGRPGTCLPAGPTLDLFRLHYLLERILAAPSGARVVHTLNGGGRLELAADDGPPRIPAPYQLPQVPGAGTRDGTDVLTVPEAAT